MEAQGEAERQKLEASGVKQAIDTILGSLRAAEADGTPGEALKSTVQMLMFQRYLEAQEKFAHGNTTKVLMFPTKDSIPLAHDSLRSLFPMQ